MRLPALPLKVTRADLGEQFDALISGARSREDVERWAQERISADDIRELVFDPPAEREELWRALLYLLGVGLRVDVNEYLHSTEDFVRFRSEVRL